MRRTALLVASLGLLILGGGMAFADFAPIESEAAFRARCRGEILRVQPGAAPWVDDRCAVTWRRALAAAPMAEAILALAPEMGGAAPSRADARMRLTAVRWSSDREGALDGLEVRLSDEGGIAFRWWKQGSDGRYDLVEALRIRGVALRTLGCPQYPGASMGAEKVMTAVPLGRAPFTLTVYSRLAPTAVEPTVYEADAEFGAMPPDMAALRAGSYPGGGGRAFAVDPTGWTAECTDPE
jgi:hypothetical protein